VRKSCAENSQVTRGFWLPLAVFSYPGFLFGGSWVNMGLTGHHEILCSRGILACLFHYFGFKTISIHSKLPYKISGWHYGDYTRSSRGLYYCLLLFYVFLAYSNGQDSTCVTLWSGVISGISSHFFIYKDCDAFFTASLLGF
jgi:hypothetical protein